MASQQTDQRTLLTTREAAKVLGCRPTTLLAWVRCGVFPEPLGGAVGQGGRYAWMTETVMAWRMPPHLRGGRRASA